MMKTFQLNKPLPLIYVLNNLEDPKFSVDLWELFGSEDNFMKALVGKWDAKKGNFKSITWDWPIRNIRHVFNIIYFLSCLQKQTSYLQGLFDSFFETELEHSTDLINSLVKAGLTRPINCLYVMKYKRQFPALIIEWERIIKEPERERPLLITFRPIGYFMMDPDAWYEVWKRSRDIQEWINTYNIPQIYTDEFSEIFSKYVNMKQYVYGLLPRGTLYDGMRRSKVLFAKPVEPVTKIKIVSDNLIFWTLFYYLTGASRAKYDIKIDTEYLIRHIPIDALNIRSNVYKHEAGVANVLSHVLVEFFCDKYLNLEFIGKNEISYKESVIFRREFQVRSIKGEEINEFADSDYDFALNLQPLEKDKLILIDLTTALWKKGLLPYEEYLRRWRETCFNIPLRHADMLFIWYVLVNETEKHFFEGPPPNKVHKNFDEMLKDLSSECPEKAVKVISDESDLTNYSGERIIILKLFRKTPTAKNSEEELENLLYDYKRTLFYGTCSCILKNILKTRDPRNL
jgi:hypothetical protein